MLDPEIIEDHSHKLTFTYFFISSLVIHSYSISLGARTIGPTLAIGTGVIGRTLATRPTFAPTLAVRRGLSSTTAASLVTTARLSFHFFFLQILII